MTIDVERLRRDLIDYFGSAMQFYSIAIMKLSEVESCSDNRVVEIALENGFNLYDYEIKEYKL